jgi:hypothetical protein
MAREVFYRQCRMERANEHTTAWIPETLAVVGKVLRLKQGDAWVEGWRVTQVWKKRLSAEEVGKFHGSVKAHRRATGDSSPREETR